MLLVSSQSCKPKARQEVSILALAKPHFLWKHSNIERLWILVQDPIHSTFVEVCRKPSGKGIWCDVDEAGEQAYSTAAEVFGHAYGENPGQEAVASGRIARPRMTVLYYTLDSETGCAVNSHEHQWYAQVLSSFYREGE